ncbi:bacteriocin immunity protein [Enterococcus sp. DIV0800]|uniref:bacteriocin immunity protein n=1 Tax=unclassified Enterococcus TaxID=2608891 RepID=UPI003D2FFA2F
MTKLKWFSGGEDRSEQAIAIIRLLVNDLNHDMKTNNLRQVLENYKIELEKKDASIPFILSKMNVDISRCLRKYPITLSTFQSDKVKKLTALSNIRYGY